MKISKRQQSYLDKAKDGKVPDDFNLVKYCRFCRKRVFELFPETCPHCNKPFESTADHFFQRAACALIVVFGFFLWQKVLLGIL